MELYFKRNSMMLIGKPAELRSYLDEVCRKYNTLNDLIKAAPNVSGINPKNLHHLKKW